MDKPLAVAGLIAFAALLAALATIAYRHERRRDHAEDTNPGRLDDVLPADEPEHEWSAAALAEVRADPDPLDTTVPMLTGEDLVPAYTFADVMALHPVALDYPGISFTTEWSLAGQRLAEIGETQPLPRVEVPA